MPKQRSRAPLILVATVALMLAAAAGLSWWTTHGAMEQAAADDGEPVSVWSLRLPDTNGAVQPLAQWRGKVLVVNFWATWCPPCREEMPMLSRIHQKYAGQGAQVIGLSIDTLNKVRDFQREEPVAYPLLIGAMSLIDASAHWGNQAQALPFTAFFDRQGRLASVKQGRLSEVELDAKLKALLNGS
jgi:thiol-disulfide isomerase/thioredoxin